jgi:hypothetical protein
LEDIKSSIHFPGGGTGSRFYQLVVTRAPPSAIWNRQSTSTPTEWPPIVRNNEDRRELAMVRWGMPSSSKALFDAASKRADKLRAKAKEFDFNELLKTEPDGGTTNTATHPASIGNGGSAFRTAASFPSPASPNPTRPARSTASARRTPGSPARATIR